MIELFDVSVRHPSGELALEGIDLSVFGGETVFLVGPTGAGKSTLLRLLYADLLPTSGNVVVLGRSTLEIGSRALCRFRREFGIVFQDHRLLADRTVQENVALVLEASGRRGRDVARRTVSMLRQVGLGERAGEYPERLSGGERQRVALARALAGDPRIVVADEPAAQLDPESASEVYHLLGDMAARGAAVLVATHEPPEAADRATFGTRTRIVELVGGRLAEREGARWVL